MRGINQIKSQVGRFWNVCVFVCVFVSIKLEREPRVNYSLVLPLQTCCGKQNGPLVLPDSRTLLQQLSVAKLGRLVINPH